MQLTDMLGMNARNFRYTSVYNTPKAKKIANSKLLTKQLLKAAKLPAPKLYQAFTQGSEIDSFNFARLPDSFVVKPNKGLGGEGIIVIEKKIGKKKWLDTQGEVVTDEDISLHIEDILEGRFSPQDLPDIAFIEERVRIHPLFAKYAYHGTPDIRLIIFNRVPVMAMLRLPTRESGGRANLFQGAVAAGIDMRTGTTTHAIVHGKEIVFTPDTKKKIRGLVIPEWDEVMKLAIRCQEVTGLGYLGADIVLQPSIKTPGKTLPKVLELNAQPGLKIQLANKVGLQRRLERVEGVKVVSPEHGIRIAKELFSSKVAQQIGKTVKAVGVFEPVKILDAHGKKHTVKAKLDTGAFRSSIDRKLAHDLGLLTPDNVIMRQTYSSALGKSEREVIGITYYLSGRKIQTTASVADRSARRTLMLVGRRDLKGFTIHFS
jgi:alpha-L-glutamate ligase-like protein